MSKTHLKKVFGFRKEKTTNSHEKKLLIFFYFWKTRLFQLFHSFWSTSVFMPFLDFSFHDNNFRHRYHITFIFTSVILFYQHLHKITVILFFCINVSC
jgi:hypothetical protein